VATGGATYADLEKQKPDWLVPDLTHLPPEVVAGR
jgi:hypothetical protein